MYYYTISQSEFSRYKKNPNTILVDLRNPAEFQKGHIPDAINIPFEELKNKPISDFNHEMVILYCDRGNKSLLIARDLQKKGIAAVSIHGGYFAYQGPVETTHSS